MTNFEVRIYKSAQLAPTMETAEEVRKMTEFIKKHKKIKEEPTLFVDTNYPEEFNEFVSFKDNFSADEYEDDDLDDPPEYSAFSNDDISTTTLTAEEQVIIDSTPDPDLKQLLILNRKKNMQLLKLHKKIRDIIIKCEDVMEEKGKIIKNLNVRKRDLTYCPSWKLAAPYFKDKQYFGCPPNEDTLKKRAEKELSLYELHPSVKWTPWEFDRLLSAVKCNYNINQQKEVVGKLSVLQKTIDVGNCEDSEHKEKLEKIKKLQEELEKLEDNNENEVPPLGSDSHIDWYKVADMFLGGKNCSQ